MNSLSTCPQTGPLIYTGGYVALSAINVKNTRACLASSIELAYDWLFWSAQTYSAHKRSSALNVQELKRLVALMLYLVSVQPCVGQEIEKREKV